jgi:hypothetical protein
MPYSEDLVVEHIDPLWPDGNKYQLICGLDIKENTSLQDHSYNIRKTNRFVPYRVVNWLAVHQEPGDWGIFLIDGEWKLTRFMGAEWWAESNKIGCSHTEGGRAAVNSGQLKSVRNPSKAGKVGGKRQKPGHLSAIADERWICLESGFISNAPGVVRWQKKQGYSTERTNRARVKQP